MSKDDAIKALRDSKSQLQEDAHSTNGANVLEHFTHDGVLWFPRTELSLWPTHWAAVCRFAKTFAYGKGLVSVCDQTGGFFLGMEDGISAGVSVWGLSRRS